MIRIAAQLAAQFAANSRHKRTARRHLAHLWLVTLPRLMTAMASSAVHVGLSGPPTHGSCVAVHQSCWLTWWCKYSENRSAAGDSGLS
jgi:hypothetical protein